MQANPDPLEEGVWRFTGGPGETAERVGSRERSIEAFVGRFIVGQLYFEGCGVGKVISPARRREAVANTVEHYGISERLACRV